MDNISDENLWVNMLGHADDEFMNNYENDSIARALKCTTNLDEGDGELKNGVELDDLRKQKLLSLLQRTKCFIRFMRNQRIFGPPVDYEGERPPHGTEVFVSQLPMDAMEDEIIPIFEGIGPIYECRIIMQNQFQSRGYCYITYFNKLNAQTAVTILNQICIRPNRKLLVLKSINNCRLFMGNIPNTLDREELLHTLDKVMLGVKDVIVYQSKEYLSFNRGFAFIEFNTHRDAAIARKQYHDGVVKFPWQKAVMIDWSVPLPDVEPEIMQTVKIIYIRNLSISMTKNLLWLKLSTFLEMETVVRIHKMMDFCFIHFNTRENAEKAMRKLQAEWHGKFGGIEVQWARPRKYSNKRYYQQNEAQKTITYYKSFPKRLKSLEGSKQLQSSPCGSRFPNSLQMQGSGYPSSPPPPVSNEATDLLTNVASNLARLSIKSQKSIPKAGQPGSSTNSYHIPISSPDLAQLLQSSPQLQLASTIYQSHLSTMYEASLQHMMFDNSTDHKAALLTLSSLMQYFATLQ